MRRAFVMALVTTVVALIAPGSADALNRQYTVLKCHVFAPTSSEVQVEAQGAYRSVDACGSPDQRFELTVDGFGLPGQAASIRIRAPDNTAIVGVIVDANLRRENHHLAQLGVVEPNGTPTVLANGNDSGSGFQNYTFSGLNGTYFVAQLVCSDPSGCPNSTQAHAFVKNIALVLEDRADPGITALEGDLFDSGWLKGLRKVGTDSTDLGSGVAFATLAVNGVEVIRTSPACAGRIGTAIAFTLVPCPSSARLGPAALDTARSPFVNGANDVAFCVVDFAGNTSCQSKPVAVDNESPRLAFADDQDPADPELIRVSAGDSNSGIDPTSGLISYRPVGSADWVPLPTRFADGWLTARVDSGIPAPGKYEFSASATDIAGNLSLTNSRANGDPMVLSFPLRESVQLISRLDHGDGAGETVPYGRDSKAQGRLLDHNGEPLAHREVTVTEYFGAGALIDQRVRVVVTNERGRWRSALPAGPSRTVDVTFAGTPRYQPVEAASVQLRVRSRATFSTSRDRVREGRAIKFEGKVGHFGARVPPGGKLIELQVREGQGRWNTVREAFHTDASGHFQVRYRFGRFYETNAHFVFRVKVAREQGWPYQAPGRSRTRRVTVVANR